HVLLSCCPHMFSYFSFYCYRHHRDLHSFPTRRSSDLRAKPSGRTSWSRGACSAAPCAARSSAWRPPGGGSQSPSPTWSAARWARSEEHTSELQSRGHLVCRLLLEKKN